MATFSDIRLMGVSGGSSELNSSTSTYKAEVERTEALQAYFNQQIINIFNELAKDNSITKSNKISQIIPGIQEVKSVRKRFAFGENTTINVEQEYKESTDFYVGSFNLSVNFNPSLVIVKCDNMNIPLIYKKDNQGYLRTYVAYNYWRYRGHNYVRLRKISVVNDKIYDLDTSDGATDTSTTVEIRERKIKLEMVDKKFEVFLSETNPSNLEEDIDKKIKKVEYWAAFE